MDGGFITGALLGAGSSLLMKKDPITGAVLGGVTGGLFGGGPSPAPAAAGSTSPLSTGSLLNGAGTNLLAGGDPLRGLTMNASALAGSPSAMGTSATGSSLGSGINPFSGGMGFNPASGGMGLQATNSMASSLAPNSLAPGVYGSIPDISQTQAMIRDPLNQQLGLGSVSGGVTDLPSAAGVASTSSAAPIAPAAKPEFLKDPVGWFKTLPAKEKMLYGIGGTMAASTLMGMNQPKIGEEEEEKYKGPLSKFRYDPGSYVPSLPMAEGGIATLGGANISVGGDPRRNPPPISQDSFDQSGWQAQSSPTTHMAGGGIADLGSYSDGGRLLKGPGDGMSDHIPATIGQKQPARLAEGEFVIPADVVSHLGNGSTDAGAKQLYAMMNRVRKARTGKAKQGRQINPKKYLPMAEGGTVSMASGGDTSENRTPLSIFNTTSLPFFQYMTRKPAATTRPKYTPSLNQASTDPFYRTMDTPQSGYRPSISAPAFFQPIYHGAYEDYNVSNPLSISQYGTEYQSPIASNPGIAGLLAQFNDAARANASQSSK